MVSVEDINFEPIKPILIAIVISNEYNDRLRALLDRLNIELNGHIVLEYRVGKKRSRGFDKYYSDDGLRTPRDYDEKVIFCNNEHLNKPADRLKKMFPGYYIDSEYHFQRIENENSYIIYKTSLNVWKILSNFFKRSITEMFDVDQKNFKPLSNEFRDIKIRIDTDKTEPCFKIGDV